MTPSSGGFEPKWVTELKTATFGMPEFDFVPIRLADLNPEQLLIRLILKIWSNSSKSWRLKCIISNVEID
jgi:hypothetical protein